MQNLTSGTPARKGHQDVVAPDYLRQQLKDPGDLCRKLNLLDRARRQSTGLLICCVKHEERAPSCSVTTGRDGTIRVKCFGCDWTSDAIGLIAAVHGHSRSMFADTLRVAAELAGERGGPMLPPPKIAPPPEYPPQADVLALWQSRLASVFGARLMGVGSFACNRP